MSQEVFSKKASVFFVTDEAGGSQYAGGCTLQYVLDNGGFENFDYAAKLMGDNDYFFAFSIGASYNNTTGVITENIPGDFSGVEVGMVLYAEATDEAEFEEPGRYEVTAVGAGTITIQDDLDFENVLLDVYVGGAFDTMENALDNITADDADGKHDCYLFTKKNDTLENYTVLSGGSREYNSKLFITGFNTGLLDMFPGGDYYQSEIDAWYLGVDADCHITIDLNDANYLSFGSHNIIVQNLRITNNSSDFIIFIASNMNGFVFYNCIIDEGNQLIKGNYNNETICFVNCYFFGSTNSICATGDYVNLCFQGCVVDHYDTNNNMFVATKYGTCVVADCLLIGGSAIFVSASNFIEWNNTIIGHTSNTIKTHYMASNISLQVGWGDIIVLPQAGYVMHVTQNGGTLLWKGFSALWGTDDAEYEGGYQQNDFAGGNESIRDFNCLDIDPELDSNHRPRNPQILRGGSGGRSPLGAFKQKYQFPQKARIVNHGRAGIVK